MEAYACIFALVQSLPLVRDLSRQAKSGFVSLLAVFAFLRLGIWHRQISSSDKRDLQILRKSARRRKQICFWSVSARPDIYYVGSYRKSPCYIRQWRIFKTSNMLLIWLAPC